MYPGYFQFAPLCQILDMPLSVYSILEANLMFSYPLKGASKCIEFASKSQENRWQLGQSLRPRWGTSVPRSPDLVSPLQNHKYATGCSHIQQCCINENKTHYAVVDTFNYSLHSVTIIHKHSILYSSDVTWQT